MRPRFLSAIVAAVRPPRFTPGWAWACAWLLWWLAATPAWAIEEIPASVALLIDPQGTQTIESVQRAEFRPTSVPLSLGYTAAAAWLRITVPPSPQPRLVLLVQPQTLDSVRLYRPAEQDAADAGTAGAQWEAVDAGDLFPYAQRERAEAETAFYLEPSATGPTTVYLRIQTKGSSLVRPWVLTPGDSLRFDAGLHALTGLYGGVVLCLLGVSLICWWTTRDGLWGYSALFHLLSLLYTLFVMGFAAKFVLDTRPAAADLGTSLLGCAHFAAVNLLGLKLIRAFEAPRWATPIYLVPLAAFPLQLACLLLWDAPRWALASNVGLLLLQAFVAPVVIWFVPLPDRPVRYLLRTMTMVVALYVIFYAMPLFGIGHLSDFNVYPAMAANLFVEIAQQCILARRMQLQLRERRLLQGQLRDTATRLDVEQRGRREAAGFLDMLIHEVKNPLAAIRVAAATLRSGRLADEGQRAARLDAIQHSVADIDAVLRQCTDLDQLEQGVIRVNRSPQDVAQLLQAEAAQRPGADRIALQAAPLSACVDATLLRLMLRNLLDNALRYSPPAGTVQVALAAQAHEGRAGFEIAVRNAAGRAGLPDPERLFGKYYRAPRAQHLSGTGLGLYWVHEVATLNGGHIRYRPLCRDGIDHAVFTLWLPCEA